MRLYSIVVSVFALLLLTVGLCLGSTHTLTQKHLRSVEQIREHHAANAFRNGVLHQHGAHPPVHVGTRFAHNPVVGRRAAPRTAGIMAQAIASTPRTRVRILPNA